MQDDLPKSVRWKEPDSKPGTEKLLVFTPAMAVALRELFETDRITTLTGRLAALEQATPEEVASAAADAMERETAAINAERIDGHEMPRMYRQEKERMTRAVLSAIAPRLRAQGAAVERERAAAVCEEISERLFAMDDDRLSSPIAVAATARNCASAIRAGGSGG